MKTQTTGGRPAVVSRVSGAARRTVVELAIRDDEMARAVVRAITAAGETAAVDAFGSAFASVLHVLKGYLDRDEMPERPYLEADLAELVGTRPDLLSEFELDEALAVVRDAWEKPAYRTVYPNQRQWAREKLQAILLELVSDDFREAAGSPESSTASSDLRGLIDRTSELVSTIVGATLPPNDGRVFSGPDVLASEVETVRIPTGVKVLDLLTGGGPRVGDANVIAGPFGSCKTVVALDAVAKAAVLAHREGRANHVAIYCSYEMDESQVKKRLLANVARVPLGRLMDCVSLADLAGPGDARPDYEVHCGMSGPSERERVTVASAILDAHFRFYDFSQRNPKLLDQGSGGIDELVPYLKTVVKRDRLTPTAVWVDHVNAIVDQWIPPVGTRDAETVKRNMLTGMPKRFAQLASQWGTAVWMVAQLSGAAQSFHPTMRLGQADLADCKSLGRYASTMMFFTKPGEVAPRYLRARSDKTRHGAVPDLVAKLNGDFQHVEYQANMRVSESTRTFVAVDPQRSAAGTPSAQTTPPNVRSVFSPRRVSVSN